MPVEPSKHLTVFSSETVNIKKLANLTANTKTYGQITLNTKPHSDPLTMIFRTPTIARESVYAGYTLFTRSNRSLGECVRYVCYAYRRVTVEGEDWMVLAIDKYDYGIF